MASTLSLAAFAITAASLLTPSARADFPEVGKAPPEVNAKTWFNNMGPDPSLASLKGQVVLIEFWATWCAPCKAAWPHLNELHSTYAKDGLVILGLSDETNDKIDPFLEELEIECIVGGGSTANAAYGVEGIPHTFVVGTDGKLAWHGHPSELSESMLKDLLKSAKKVAGGILGVKTTLQVDARAAKAESLAAEGKLADALREIGAIENDPKASDAQKGDAKALREAIEKHTAGLLAAAEKSISSQDVEKAVKLLEAVSKELGATPQGVKAKERLEAVRADPKLKAELEAARAFAKLKDQTKTLATAKLRAKYDEFAKRFPGTKAGERAKQLARTAEKG